MDSTRYRVRRVGPAWAAGLAGGALSGWVILTQTFPAVLAAALLWVAFALLSRQLAVLGGLFIGLGASWLALTAAAGWQAGSWAWALLSIAVLMAGTAVTRVALRERNAPGARRPAYRRSRAIVVSTALASLLFAGFGLPVRPYEYPLPTGFVPWWLPVPCAGVGLEAVVRGSPNDPRVTWLEDHLAGGIPRLEATWPEGYRARFTPKLEVLDGWGNVVLRDGDPVAGACYVIEGDPREFFLEPPFN